MPRTQRVRHTPTPVLEAELAALLVDWTMQVDHDQVLIDGHCRLCSRWFRVAREIARRDYRFRAHGQRCTCAECVQLAEEWSLLQRGSRNDLAPRG